MKYPTPKRSMLMAGMALFGTVSVVWSDAVDIVATSAVEDVTEALFEHLQEKQPKWTANDLKPVTIEYGSPTIKLEMVPVPGGTPARLGRCTHRWSDPATWHSPTATLQGYEPRRVHEDPAGGGAGS